MSTYSGFLRDLALGLDVVATPGGGGLVVSSGSVLQVRAGAILYHPALQMGLMQCWASQSSYASLCLAHFWL